MGLVSPWGWGGSARPACVLSATFPAPGGACHRPAGPVASVMRLQVAGNWGTGGAELLWGARPWSLPPAYLPFSGVKSVTWALREDSGSGWNYRKPAGQCHRCPKRELARCSAPSVPSALVPRYLSTCSARLALWLCAQLLSWAPRGRQPLCLRRLHQPDPGVRGLGLAATWPPCRPDSGCSHHHLQELDELLVLSLSKPG